MRVRKIVGYLVVALAVGLSSTAGLAGEPSRAVFKAKSDEGEVWVSVDLTRQRLGEPYVPMVIVVYNNAKRSAVIERPALRLIGTGGTAHQVASIKEIRQGYPKLNFDLTMVRMYGLPFGTYLQPDRVIPSIFFPMVRGRGAVKIDRVELPRFYWSVDLYYFQRPAGLAEGKTVTLQAAPEGWKQPIEVRIKI